jgi:hypothetical protein
MDWAAVNTFLDSLPEPQNESFDEWFGKYWEIHQKRCQSAALNTYVLEMSVSSFKNSGRQFDEQVLKKEMTTLCVQVGLEPIEYIELAWPTFEKRCCS